MKEQAIPTPSGVDCATIAVLHPIRLVGEAIAYMLNESGQFRAFALTPPEAVGYEHGAQIVLAVAAGAHDAQLSSIRLASDTFPDANVVVVGGDTAPTMTVQYVEHGATAFIPMEARTQQFLDQLQRVVDKNVEYDPNMMNLLFRRMSQLSAEAAAQAPAATSKLTPRESEVLDLVSRGLSNKEIAAELHVQLSTVKNHVHNLLEKLGANSRMHARFIAESGHAQ